MKKVLSERLRQLRGAVSQGDFAASINVTQTAYSSWERGRHDPAASSIIIIAQVYHVTADWLLGLSDERTPGARPSMNVSDNPNAVIAGTSATVSRDCEHCPHVSRLLGIIERLVGGENGENGRQVGRQ